MTREKALSILLEVDGGLKAGTCSETGRWYQKHDRFDIRDFIIEWTKFLIDCSFKERMLYFKLGIDRSNLCKICSSFRRKPAFETLTFQHTCGSDECKKRWKSKTSIEMHKNLTDEQRHRKNVAIGKANSGSFDEKFDKETAQRLRKNISKFLTGRKQSKEQKENRVNGRMMNGKPWHADITKKKISESNKITHLNPEFREKYHETYEKAHVKQSNVMKEKILRGEFTPKSNNRRIRKNSWLLVDGSRMSFRSSWECVFFEIKNCELGRRLEYEKIRLPYQLNEKKKIYIVDFFDPIERILFEIKPRCFLNDEIELLKFDTARNWANVHDCKFVIVENDWFVSKKQEVLRVLDDNPHLPQGLRNVVR